MFQFWSRVWNVGFRQAYGFKYVYTIDGADFYVAADVETRWQLFDAQGYVAFTYGDTVYARSKRALTPRVIRHELKHVEQHRRGGMGTAMDYMRETRKRGYWGNKYERAARRAERKVRQLDRTVRRKVSWWQWLTGNFLGLLFVLGFRGK